VIFKRSSDDDSQFALCCRSPKGAIVLLEFVHEDVLYDFLPRWIWDEIHDAQKGAVVEVDVPCPEARP